MAQQTRISGCACSHYRVGVGDLANPPQAAQDFLRCLAIRTSGAACLPKRAEELVIQPTSQFMQEFLHDLADPDVRERLLATVSASGDGGIVYLKI